MLICSLEYKLHINTDYHMVIFFQRRMRSNSARVGIRTKEIGQEDMADDYQSGMRVGKSTILCHRKPLTKQTCNISGVGMTKSLCVRFIEVTKPMILAKGWRSDLSIFSMTHPQPQKKMTMAHDTRKR